MSFVELIPDIPKASKGHDKHLRTIYDRGQLYICMDDMDITYRDDGKFFLCKEVFPTWRILSTTVSMGLSPLN